MYANTPTQIYDQYLHFVSLEDRLFSLNFTNSYAAFNDHSISDSEAEANVDAIVDALFCVLATLVHTLPSTSTENEEGRRGKN